VDERVLDEIPDDPLEGTSVGKEDEIFGDLDLYFLPWFRGTFQRELLDETAKAERLDRESGSRRLQPGEIKEVVGELHEPHARVVERIHELSHGRGIECLLPLGQSPGDAENDSGRSSKFVRGRGDEFALERVEQQQFLVDERTLEAEGHALGDEAEKLRVLFVENAVGQRPYVDHAEDALAGDERRAEQRLDSLLAQDGVQHVGVVGVLDEHYAPLGCDPAGEALADGDPDSALDFLLDALGRPRNELVGFLVKQEDRARVGLERVTDAFEQRVEHVVEGKVSEGDVGHGLKLAQTLVAGHPPWALGHGRINYTEHLLDVPILGRVEGSVGTAVVLTVGSEIVSGDVENTNASWLARRLAGLGVEVKLIAAVRDDISEIAAFLRAEAPRADFLFVTGGLGGTPDDITREAVAAGFGVECEEVVAVAQELRTRFEPRGLGDYAARWACLPRGAEPLANPLGGAPGFVLQNVFVFPGLPREMEAMFDSVAGRFRGRAISTWRQSYRTGEGQIVAILEEATRRHPAVTVGSYPRFLADGPEVEIVLKSSDDEALALASAWVEHELEARLS
jgi:molybdenum cofactor synthesis domain-containing protein